VHPADSEPAEGIGRLSLIKSFYLGSPGSNAKQDMTGLGRPEAIEGLRAKNGARLPGWRTEAVRCGHDPRT
jgi:hypothetical protein